MNNHEEKLRVADGDFRALMTQAKPNTPIKKEFQSYADRFNMTDSNLTFLHDLVFLGFDYDDTYSIPDYQRELVWTTAQKQNLIMSILRGLPIGNFTFRYDDSDTVAQKFHVIDGQQRIQAIREFAIGHLCLEDGRNINDLGYWDVREFFSYTGFKAFKIKNISLVDEIGLYLEINAGGTLHTNEEIQKAKDCLMSLNS